jgi:hypothetical protein
MAAGGDRRDGDGSPSGLSVDNYVMNSRDSNSSRPQTGTWAETFSLFKAKFVGSSSSTSVSVAPSPISPSAGGIGEEGDELRRGSNGTIGPLVPSAEL